MFAQILGEAQQVAVRILYQKLASTVVGVTTSVPLLFHLEEDRKARVTRTTVEGINVRRPDQ